MKLPVLRVASLSVAVLVLASCGGDAGKDDASPDSAPVLVSDGGGGGVAEPSDGGEADPAEGGAGFESAGSPLADENREEYIAMGATDEDLAGVAWAGDVSTEEGAFIEYPDGLRVDFVGVEEGSAPESEAAGGLDPEKQLVTVTLKVSNSGDAPVSLDPGYVPFLVFEGPNLAQADQFVGYGEPGLTSEGEENAVGAGSEFEVFLSFEVEPGASIEVETNPDYFGWEHTPYVFTGVTAP